MTEKAPAGWYADPDPERSDDLPPQERWWDGETWTDEVRPAHGGAAGVPGGEQTVPGGSGVPPVPVGVPAEVISGGPAGEGPRPGRRPLVVGVAIGVAVALFVGGGVAGGYALWGGEGGDEGPAQSERQQRSPGPEGPGDGDREQVPSEDGYATDLASGIKLPVPDGWEGQSGQIGASVSVGEYKCPTAPDETCVRGGVNSVPALALGIEERSAKATAQKDIETNAEQSYGEESYGGIDGHEEVKSGEVTVAGEQGYFVRWKVETEEGSDGYVQSLAFPSPADHGTMILVRSGFDIGGKAPDLAQMDEITEGIEEAAGGGGIGRPA